MCTVTYIPTIAKQFILTSNRDENAMRSPRNITHVWERNQDMIFPRDNNAGGTWIAASEKNKVVCLLNGAFVKHAHQPPYRLSRGIMVMDFFDFAHATDFFEQYDLSGIEPFTLVVIDGGRLFEFRWDEAQKYIRELDPALPAIWASATLYPPPVQEKRREWFDRFLANHEAIGPDDIYAFHRYTGDGDPYNDLVMNRDGRVQTVSITQIISGPDQIEMIYNDLLNNVQKKEHVRLEKEAAI